MSKLILEKNNELPKGWMITSLENVGKIITGNTPSKKDPQNYGNYLPWVKPPQLEKESPIVDTPEKLSEQGASLARILEKKSILVSCIGELGKIGIAGTKLATNQQINAITFHDFVDPKFGFYFFKSRLFVTWLHENSSATVVQIINKGRFSKAPFILCSLEEQKRIVAKIEELFSLIESTKQLFEKTKTLLKQYRQSLLKSAFEGKLVPQDPNDEPVKIIPVIQKKNTGRKASIDVTLGKSALSVGKPDLIPPPNWKWVPLLQIAELASGHTPKRNHPEYWNGDIQWVTGGDAGRNDGNYIFGTKEKITQLGINNSAAVILPKDTVCLAREASIGFCTILGKPMATNQRFVNFICGESLIPKYLMYLFLHERSNMFRFKEGTIFGTIYFPAVKAFHICIPPLNEQKRIVAKIEESFSLIQNSEKLVDSLLLQNNSIKNSILKQAFEGKLIPQDPNDEPAEILLEKIKHEKQKIISQNKKPRRKNGT